MEVNQSKLHFTDFSTETISVTHQLKSQSERAFFFMSRSNNLASNLTKASSSTNVMGYHSTKQQIVSTRSGGPEPQ